MRFTRIPETTFKNIQLNAGILVKGFDPVTMDYTGLLGATTGGITFNAAPTFDDFGSDIDNCPKNTLELKKLTEWAVSLSGTFVTITAESAKTLVGAGVIDENDATHIIPRNDLASDFSDFEDIWWIGDYSDKNGDTDSEAGYVAIHMLNALNTGGFQIKSTDKGKGNFAFNFEGHYSMNAQTTVPFEVYVKGDTAGDTPYVLLEKHEITIAVGQEVTINADVNPSDATVTYSSDSGSVATFINGVVKGIEAGNTVVNASIQYPASTGPIYKDTCTVIVESSNAQG